MAKNKTGKSDFKENKNIRGKKAHNKKFVCLHRALLLLLLLLVVYVYTSVNK